MWREDFKADRSNKTLDEKFSEGIGFSLKPPTFQANLAPHSRDDEIC